MGKLCSVGEELQRRRERVFRDGEEVSGGHEGVARAVRADGDRRAGLRCEEDRNANSDRSGRWGLHPCCLLEVPHDGCAR